MNTKKTVYDVYISSIYRRGLINLVFAAFSASVFYTAMKIMGLYPMVSWITLIIFDLMDFCFILISLFIIRESIHNGILKKDKLFIGKFFTFFLLVVQWNFILYMIPSKTFLGFFFFFVILSCFFLDIKLIITTAGALILSLYLFCKLKGQQHPYLTLPELKRADFVVFITSITFAVAGIIIFVFFMTHIQWIYQKSEQQLKLQKKYYNKIMQKDNGIRQFRHDIKKHTMALTALCEEDDIEAVKKYVRSMSEQEIQNSFVHTGNSLADCFVNDLIDELQHTGNLTWQVIGNFPANISISDIDFCVILGNAIENAKEALLALPPEKERKFYLTIKHYQERLYIHMQNTADEEDLYDEMFSSPKGDDESHGYGLNNIKMTLNKYNGSAEWNLQDGVFTIDIYI